MSEFTEFQPFSAPNPNAMLTRGYDVVSSGPQDANKIVAFKYEKVPNAKASRDSGRPVYDNKIFVMIHEPGDKLTTIEREASDDDKRRWPQQWAQFMQGAKQVAQGAPLHLLFPDNPAIVANLNNYNIQTIEQLAALQAHGIQTVGMGCQEWVNKAQAWIKQAEKGVDFHKFQSELKQRDDMIAALQGQIAALNAQMTAIVQNRTPTNVMPDMTNFDIADSMIQNTHELGNVSNVVALPDLGQVEPKKRGWPAGKPRGPRKPKES